MDRARWIRRAAGGALVATVIVALHPGCIFAITQTSLGQGDGTVTGALSVPDCWSGGFDLQPDFFAGVPYLDSYDIRIQNGSDFETFSDGLSILVDNVHAIRPDNGPGLYGQALTVSLPAGVTPPGVPIKANPNPASVHMSLYLARTCHTQNPALYAIDQVTLNASGTCDAVNGAPIQIQCGAAAPTDAGPAVDASTLEGGAGEAGAPAPSPTGQSTITFTHLFDDNPNETDAQQRLTQATFEIFLADPRDICPGGLGPPPPCRGHLTGSFKFYFQRGRPGQPFP
jgi:hypothetical protein